MTIWLLLRLFCIFFNIQLEHAFNKPILKLINCVLGPPQGAFSGIFVGFLVSLWLAVGSTLYPPSAQTMGVLDSYSAQCGSSNTTVDNITHKELLSISGLADNEENRWELVNAVCFVSICIYCNYQRPTISYFNDSYMQLDNRI